MGALGSQNTLKGVHARHYDPHCNHNFKHFCSKFCSTFKGYESKADIFVLNKPSSFFVNSRDNIGILPDEKILLLKPGSL